MGDNSGSLAIIIAIIEAIIILGRLLPPLSTTSLTLTFAAPCMAAYIFSPCPRRSLLPPSAGQRTAGRQVGRSVIKIMPPTFWILAQIITDSLLSLLLLFMGIIASYYWGDNVLLLSQVECRQGIQAHSAPRPLELFWSTVPFVAHAARRGSARTTVSWRATRSCARPLPAPA